MDTYEIVRLRRDNQHLRMLVDEARESRDQAEAKAKEAVQAEMAELRKTIAVARARLPFHGKNSIGETVVPLRPGEMVQLIRELHAILSGGKE